jgi:3-hydroxyacyl-CoA dehydrogenase
VSNLPNVEAGSIPGRVDFAMEGDVAVLTINNPPVNASSQAVRAGIVQAIEAATTLGAQGAVLMGAGRVFVAGADLREFGQPLAPPELPDVIACIEAAPFPVLAALHGVALGGGLELSLGCDWRIASADTMVGLPEVSLGFVPGAGGTLRLPRLVGRVRAMDLVCRAARIPAQQALEIGLIDEVVDGDLLQAALAFLAAGRGKRLVRDLIPPQESGAELDAAAAKFLGRGKVRLNVAEAIRLIRASDRAADTALSDERAVFRKLRASDDAFALRHLFFAERRAAQVEGLDIGTARAVTRVGVIGGGTMGQGIARTFLAVGLPVVLVERDEGTLANALQRTVAGISAQVAKGRLAEEEAANRRACLSGAVNYAALQGCDVVIEAVFEDMAVKKDVLAKLEAVLPSETILATNTSYLDIDKMAEELTHPERVLGLHFFSPADVMKLLEVVRARATSDATLATGLKLARKLGKQPVVAQVGEGFIGNRIYAAYRRCAELMVLDGASPEQVDDAAKEFGFAMGPFAVSDMSGLDIAWATRKRQAATRDPESRYVTIPDQLCEAGRLGRKTGKGWYAYPEGRPVPDPEVAALIDRARLDAGIKPVAQDVDGIQRKLLAAMVNEASCLLAEGIAQRASDIDVVMTNGYGFPRWQGGPLYWAARHDRETLSRSLRELAETIGHGFRAGPVDETLDGIDISGKAI